MAEFEGRKVVKQITVYQLETKQEGEMPLAMEIYGLTPLEIVGVGEFLRMQGLISINEGIRAVNSK